MRWVGVGQPVPCRLTTSTLSSSMEASITGGRRVMNARSFSLLAAIIFTVVAAVQLIRAVLGWSVTADVGSGPMAVPLWPSWIACVVFAVLAFLGFTASRVSDR